MKSLIEDVKIKRKVTESHLKFGIDGGRGFLKIVLSIQQINEDTESNNAKISSSSFQYKFKDSGVKKLILLAVAPNTQENYGNIKKLWSELNINDLIETIATDLKLANVLIGIQSHSCSYPCTWCFGQKNKLHELGEYRIIGNSLVNYENWSKAGAIKKEAKKFKSCVNPPILNGPKDKKILSFISPPELHLMIGALNTLVNHMLDEFEDDAKFWIEKCGAERELIYCGSSFNGNTCKKLLKHIDILSSNCCDSCLKYVETLEHLNSVVHDCFGSTLRESDKTSI